LPRDRSYLSIYKALRTIHLDHRDLDSAYAAKGTLAGMIESIRAGKPVETPLTHTLDIQSLRQSDDSEARGIADIIAEVQELKNVVRSTRPEPSRISTDAADLREFIQFLAATGRLTADVFRRLMSATKSKGLTRWASTQITEFFGADEPPF